MPKSKEIVSSSGSESESDNEPKQKKKKLEAKTKSKPSTSDSKGASKKGGKSDDGDEGKFEIGKQRFITVNDFRGRKMVNIREFYQADDGDMRPGKKGIALSVEQWNKLKDHIEAIDDALEAL